MHAMDIKLRRLITCFVVETKDPKRKLV
jgi:hypothetical protein